jgi:hypothetical protein
MDPAEPPVPTPFVLVTVQRSGSTYLGTVLSRVPGVFCADELFIASEGGLKPGFFYGHWRERVAADPGAILPPRRREMVESFLDAVWAAQPELAAQGFDINTTSWPRSAISCPPAPPKGARAASLAGQRAQDACVHRTERPPGGAGPPLPRHGAVPAVAIDWTPGGWPRRWPSGCASSSGTARSCARGWRPWKWSTRTAWRGATRNTASTRGCWAGGAPFSAFPRPRPRPGPIWSRPTPRTCGAASPISTPCARPWPEPSGSTCSTRVPPSCGTPAGWKSPAT